MVMVMHTAMVMNMLMIILIRLALTPPQYAHSHGHEHAHDYPHRRIMLMATLQGQGPDCLVTGVNEAFIAIFEQEFHLTPRVAARASNITRAMLG